METKGAEDVLGGADSWKNVDKTEGERWRLHLILRSNIRSHHTDTLQPNARGKVASVAWPTSDRCRFAVPTSRPRASSSVWSVLRNGAKTDEVAHL